ncbi:stage II sporulation protein D [Thalassorhabdus alkalitolerans]|uniref:Stage II sporulation protein D n=1 Tax=Thalassorhabdus alkalitolerans TaxID=2282697 RepID=A0ABW0YN12_9BACI
MKKLLCLGLVFTGLLLVMPALLVIAFSGSGTAPVGSADGTAPLTEAETSSEEVSDMADNLEVSVFRSKSEMIEEIPLEDYVTGVVASEMPASFEMEALKAQALTARTYIIQQVLQPADINLPDGAMVSDTPMHQVYHSKEELKEQWGSEYEWKINKIEEAVKGTAGQVLTFEGEPITAAFFSTSNGYTENSEDYWENEIPYLRSVESPWDQESPRYENAKRFTQTEFEQKLGITLGESAIGDIVERTEGGRVSEVVIGERTFHGRDVREKLELDSSDFTFEQLGNEVVVYTKGWGHGVGMSQYGADGMAKEGKSYKDIIQHYYQGVSVDVVDPYVPRLTAMVTGEEDAS